MTSSLRVWTEYIHQGHFGDAWNDGSERAVAPLPGRTRLYHVNISLGPAGYRKREYLTECKLVTRNLAELQQTRRCCIVRKGRKGFLILIAYHDIHQSV